MCEEMCEEMRGEREVKTEVKEEGELKLPAILGTRKRDVIVFVGGKRRAINLEYVTCIEMDDSRTRVTFEFLFGKDKYVDLENEELALVLFNSAIKIWSGDVD